MLFRVAAVHLEFRSSGKLIVQPTCHVVEFLVDVSDPFGDISSVRNAAIGDHLSITASSSQANARSIRWHVR